MNEGKPTLWQYARRKFHCHCLCALATTIPVIHNYLVSYMAICPECNERHYIRVDINDVNLDFRSIEAKE